MIGTFLFITIIMVGIGLASVLPAIFKQTENIAHDRKRLNAVIYRERISEIEQQHRDKKISDAEFAHFRDEIQQSALLELDRDGAPTTRQDNRRANKFIAVLVTIAIPITAFGLYLQLGRPDLLVGAAEPTYPQQTTGHESPDTPLKQASIVEMVDRLALRLQENPDNPEGWLMLGRSYVMLGRLDEARTSFSEAYERWPNNLEILITYAESLAQHNNGSMDGKPFELIQLALRIDPDFPSALWLAGVAAYQQNKHLDAIKYWEQLRKKGGISEQEQQILADVLTEVKRKMTESKEISN
uniref:Cytochrome c-type biogenesis protein CcmH n=1 Tax=Candidatus Kentrum sp. TUN TaxID=2126343 RepID=A0A450ZUY1_9GAMM|nr:MAG: cytochrome c-type biogenesis protein CcmH [Candidatus Kentron sp. TUN]VFK57609.1 MAG: cytochrome c-type biogenesis protein CcmH [Candidatus Kentron sp. TUN]VFK61509.1 MAG: cytochrome c-type biogenesis protein CcmH [Candidatus Kentron sp. TUN]